MSTVPSPTGAVYDRGYRPYQGTLRGHAASVWALWRLSVRRALGLRRPWRQKVLPWTLLAIATVPAIVNVGVAYVTRDTPFPSDIVQIITYRDYVGVSTTLMFFVAVTAPDIICPDLRNRVLPLVFARPLQGRDYVLAKVGAMSFIVFGFGFIPHVVLFVGQLLVNRDGALDYLTGNAEVLWQVPVSVALLAVYWAAIGVALAATTTRRIVGGVAFLALFLVTSGVSAALTAGPVEGTIEPSAWGLLNILLLPLHLRDVVFLGTIDPEGPLGGIADAGWMVAGLYSAVLALSIGFLLRRYRSAGG